MKNKLKKIKLGDLSNFFHNPYPGVIIYIDTLQEVLDYVKSHYYSYDVVEFDFHQSHYKLELFSRLITQKTIEL